MICHGTSRRHVAAIADAIVTELRSAGVRPIGVEGQEAARWILIDFGDVVVHVFDEPMRGFYDLEGLWGDAPTVRHEDRVGSPAASAPAVAKAG